MYKHLLVPLDGSALSTSLVTQAVEFARNLGARITFFTAREDVGASGDGALLRTLSPEAFAEAAAGEANAILAKAIAAAGAFGLPCEGVVRTGSRPFELILDVAAEKGCDLIFMASHGRRGLRSLVVGSQTQKVLAHSTLPVLVASVESNAGGSAADAAIGIIKDEHRAIAAVINGLRQIAGRMRKASSDEVQAPDFDFVALLVHYIKAFPETMHHPKEERYLFDRLARRTGEVADLIASLEQEHRDGTQLIEEIEVSLESARGDATQRTELADVIDRFAESQWRHLSAEEKLILPAARRHLTEEDWCDIEAAFRQNGTLAVGSERDEALRQMFTRLMNMAAEGTQH